LFSVVRLKLNREPEKEDENQKTFNQGTFHKLKPTIKSNLQNKLQK
jgi:hypothetical protein